MSSKRVSRDASDSLSASIPPVSSSRRSVLTVQAGLGAETRLLTGLQEGGRGGGGISGASNALFSTQLKEHNEEKQRKEEEEGRKEKKK